MILPLFQAATLLMAAAAPETAALKGLMVKVQPQGWTYAGSLENALVYDRGGPSAGMIWVRFEYLDAQKSGSQSVRSDAQLRNYDCKAGLYQILQRTPFAENNLAGAGVSTVVDDQTYASPGAVDKDLQNEVCSGSQ